MIFLIIIVFIGIMLYEVPGLVKKGYWRELIVFSIFTAVAFAMSLFYVIGLPLPNPVKGTEYLIKDILHLNYK